ncbi:MAG: nucleotide exchange factor GrpE [Bacteroidales bacterium]|nr:nucleotide exchange factor GrpE [Bacteroidales bacterium]
MTETTNTIEAILSEFREWLSVHSSAAGSSTDQPSPTVPVDLFTLLAQFTALRHEVNMQTRAIRAANEQVGAVLQRAQEAESEPEPDPSAALLPMAKVILDIADALQLSLRQVEKARETAQSLLADLVPEYSEISTTDTDSAEPDNVDGESHAETPPPPAPRGFWRWLWGGTPSDVPAPPPAIPEPLSVPDLRERPMAGEKLSALLAGVADGYTLSIRRVERALPLLELEVIATVGLPFDPEWMEAVEVVNGAGIPSGTVLEEIRRGYRRHGRPYRFALVKVAR